MAKIIEDSRQQVHDGDKHAAKHAWWAAHGVEVERTALKFGDYMTDGSNVAVDTKRDLYELLGNLGADYRRIDHECARAREAGYRLVFLVECGEKYADPVELSKVRARFCLKCNHGQAGRCDPTREGSGCIKRGGRHKPFQGYQLAPRMKVLALKHGARFEFCNPSESAQRICELLGVEYRDRSGDNA